MVRSQEAAAIIARPAAEAARKAAEAAAETARLERHAAAAQAQQDRELSVWQGVNKACTEIYLDDPNSALTNKVCIDLFLQIGLPQQ